MRTHYQLLGVREDASRREINAAYRKLAKRLHPDVEGGDAAKFQQATEAYSALINRVEGAVPAAARSVGPAPRQGEGAGALHRWVSAAWRRRAFPMLSVLAFALGLLLLDCGDGIHEDFNPALLGLGGLCVLLSVGFHASRGRDYVDFPDALLQAAIPVVRFLFDLSMRIYLMLVLAFSVVALLALINWLKKTFLHFLPAHF